MCFELNFLVIKMLEILPTSLLIYVACYGVP